MSGMTTAYSMFFYKIVMMCIHVKVTQSAYVGTLWLRRPHNNNITVQYCCA